MSLVRLLILFTVVATPLAAQSASFELQPAGNFDFSLSGFTLSTEPVVSEADIDAPQSTASNSPIYYYPGEPSADWRSSAYFFDLTDFSGTIASASLTFRVNNLQIVSVANYEPECDSALFQSAGVTCDPVDSEALQVRQLRGFVRRNFDPSPWEGRSLYERISTSADDRALGLYEVGPLFGAIDITNDDVGSLVTVELNSAALTDAERFYGDWFGLALSSTGPGCRVDDPNVLYFVLQLTSASCSVPEFSTTSISLDASSVTLNLTGDLQVVPIPPAIWLFATALAALGWRRG